MCGSGRGPGSFLSQLKGATLSQLGLFAYWNIELLLTVIYQALPLSFPITRAPAFEAADGCTCTLPCPLSGQRREYDAGFCSTHASTPATEGAYRRAPRPANLMLPLLFGYEQAARAFLLHCRTSHMAMLAVQLRPLGCRSAPPLCAHCLDWREPIREPNSVAWGEGLLQPWCPVLSSSSSATCVSLPRVSPYVGFSLVAMAAFSPRCAVSCAGGPPDCIFSIPTTQPDLCFGHCYDGLKCITEFL